MSLPGELIILGLIIVFLILFFVIGVENTIPVFIRTEFDNVGSYYLNKLQSTGEITVADRNDITNRLIDLGFTNIIISAPAAVGWGKEGYIRIAADYPITQTRADLSKEIKALTAVFDEKTIVMTLNR